MEAEEEAMGVSIRSTVEEEEEEEEEGKTIDEHEKGEVLNSSSVSISSIEVHKEPLHMLEHSWTFWFHNPSVKFKQATWGSSIRPIHTFSSVEDFWSLYNNIPPPSKLVVGADFHCFKYKIEPKWEDPVCANGGKWTMSFSRGKADTCWLYTLLAMIGEQFDHGDEICGAVVNVRVKQEKISIWTKNATNETAQMSIGRQLKEFLDYNDSIGFIFHEDAMKLVRSAKNRYSV